MTIPNVDNTTLNNLTPNLDIGDVADPALRLASFNYIYEKLQGIVTELNSLPTANLQNLSVTTAKIADLAVTAAKLADGAVITAKLGDLAVTLAKLAANSVDSSKIIDMAVVTSKLNDLAVTTAKIAGLSVTAAKIAEGTITETKYADGSVSTRAIADFAITQPKIGNGAVGPLQLQTGLAAIVDVQAQFAKRGIDVTSAPYFARGDGVTSDSTAINAAITAAALIGGTVYFPPTTAFYKLSSDLSVPANVNLRGEGKNSRLSGDLNFILKLNGNNVIDSLYINNTRSSSGCIGIDFAASATNITIRNCWFTGQRMQAVNITVTGVKHVNITGNHFELVNYGVLTNDGATDVYDVRVVNNEFVNIYGDAIEFNHPGTAYTGGYNLIISNNYMDVPTGYGTGSTAGFAIGIAGATRVSITGNIISNCRYQGIHLEDECKHISIMGNIIEGNQADPATPTNSGIYCIDGSHISIVGNEMYNLNDFGIHMDFAIGNQAKYTQITGNTVQGCAGGGIKLGADSGTPSDCSISNNISTGNTGNGIEIVGNPINIKIIGNISKGNSGYGLYIDKSILVVTIRDNSLYGNTTGDVGHSAQMTVPTPIKSMNIYTTGVIASNVTPYFDAFSLGKGAEGTIIINSKQGSSSKTNIYTISWDGTTLTSSKKSELFVGSTNINGPQMNGDKIQFRGSQTVADGTVIEFDVQFDGVMMYK